MIKESILRQKKEMEEAFRSKYVRRDAEIKTEKWIDKDIIKVVAGVRRAGKSFFSLHTLKGKKFGYVNFDEEEICNAKFDEVLKSVIEIYGKFNILFFDEIQNLKNWEIIVNRLKRQGYNLMITGSNANLLSGELATQLTGRYVEIEIYPFSFKEFLLAKGFNSSSTELPEDVGKILSMLRDYTIRGGFPEIVVKNYDYKEYLSTLLNAIILKDIVKRHKPKYPEVITNLVYFLISNISSLISLTKLSENLNIGSVHTAEKYVGYLEEAYLFFFLKQFSFKAISQIRSPKKVYTIDPGFYSSTAFRISENLGRLMENLVAIELLRRKSYYNPNLEIYYFKTNEGYEVDFLIKKGLRITKLIQVTYANKFDEIDKREIRALLHTKELFKGHKPEVLVITWDYEDEKEIRWFGKRGKVKFVPLWKWLLG